MEAAMSNRDRVNKLRQCECQRCKQAIGNRGFVAVPGGPVHKDCRRRES